MKLYIAITGPRDDVGRAPFTMFWLDVAGLWRSEPSPTDGKPVGYRRAQCFRAVPEEYVDKLGAILVDTETDAEKLGHAHPDVSKPIRVLRCCCCGTSTHGRQWHNRDVGHGVCARCVAYVRELRAVDPKRGEDEDAIRRLYGIEGIHWNVEEIKQPC
jgi:hypothetical protein